MKYLLLILLFSCASEKEIETEDTKTQAKKPVTIRDMNCIDYNVFGMVIDLKMCFGKDKKVYICEEVKGE